ncbi:unnamed protein product [Mytilus edulis]|uniref:Phospholipid scramblase n=1 Tax=Mytilus edulis TaxID=6550 RepID=A0A8S3UC47_MYTED|nr:unnamed protein product [Mytilus edulis]
MAQVRLHEETVKWMAKLMIGICKSLNCVHLLNFTVRDDSSKCWRFCCSRTRPLILKIYDSENRTIMELRRPYQFSRQRLLFNSPKGIKLGEIKQELQDITVGRAVKKVCSTKNLSFVVRVRSGKEVCTFEKDELSNSFKIKTTEKEIGKIEDTSHEFTEEKPGAKIFTKGNRSGITNEYKLTFSEKLSVSEKTLILAESFLADIFCIDNGLLRWNYSNEQTGASYDIVFKNSKYNKSMYIPGRALVINQISPLI